MTPNPAGAVARQLHVCLHSSARAGAPLTSVVGRARVGNNHKQAGAALEEFPAEG